MTNATTRVTTQVMIGLAVRPAQGLTASKGAAQGWAAQTSGGWRGVKSFTLPQQVILLL
jgi:hypothetical protein